MVNKYIRPLSSAYHDLVTGFYSNQTSELDNVINRNSSVYDNDGNMGLVRQVSIAQVSQPCFRHQYGLAKVSVEGFTNAFRTASKPTY